jgi:hypothetical protein
MEKNVRNCVIEKYNESYYLLSQTGTYGQTVQLAAGSNLTLYLSNATPGTVFSLNTGNYRIYVRFLLLSPLSSLANVF